MTENPEIQHAPDDAYAGSPKQPALVLVSTPIGNLGDMTFRGVTVLRGLDTLLCEDTRTTAALLGRYGISVRTEALHEHNEDARIPDILRRISTGTRVGLVSDAGTPLVSDPGYRLVRAALEAGLAVEAVPGANAALMALVLSGLPPHPYMFHGFLPPRSAARQAVLARLRAAERAGLSATFIFYEAPHRVSETLADLAAAFGPRPACVARELTKRFEQLRRAPLPDLADQYAQEQIRGEVVLLVGPAGEEVASAEDLECLLKAALATHSVREAAAMVAEATGLPRKTVYGRALALNRKPPNP
jgi:16S rRNA (cytidine1402-2'-O)-methyltransferase